MSAPVTPAPEALPGQPALSEGQRIIYTFTAPSKTFADVRRSAKWIAPFILLAVCSYLFSFSVGKKIGWEQISETQMKLAPESRQQQIEQMPPDQKANAVAMNLKITKMIAYVFPVFSLVFLLIVALILMLTFNFGLGGEVRYMQAMAVVVYACLPGVIKALLAIVLIWAGAQDPADFMIQNAFGSNPGFFMNFHETPRFLYSIATALDVFTIWTLVLTGIGFSVLTKKSRGTSMAVVFGWWILVTLVGAGLGAAFSS